MLGPVEKQIKDYPKSGSLLAVSNLCSQVSQRYNFKEIT